MARLYYLAGFFFIVLLMPFYQLKGGGIPQNYQVPIEQSLLNPFSDSIIKMNEPAAELVESDRDKINNLMELFLSQRVLATESGDLRAIAPYMKENSRFKRVMELQTAYLFSQGIRQKLLNVEILEINLMTDTENPTYSVKFRERIDMKHSDSDYIINHYTWIYRISFVDEKPLLYDLAPGSDNMKTQEKKASQASVDKIKENRFAMVDVALDGVKKYFEVDAATMDENLSAIGCRFTYGNGLLQLISNYNERKKRLTEKNITRKILTSQVKSISRGEENSVVNVSLRIEKKEGEVTTVTDTELAVILKYLGFKSWGILDIQPLPIP